MRETKGVAMYEYRCYVVKVVDGSTVDAHIDLGFNVLVRQRIKLFGIDTADIKSLDSAERDRAAAARNRLVDLLGKEFICKTILNKRGKAGRTLGHVFVLDNDDHLTNVNKQLVDEGFAIPYGD